MASRLSHRGGRRPGAGRPSTEPSSPVRVPEGLKPWVLAAIADYRQAIKSPSGAMRPDPDAPKREWPLFIDKVPAGFPSPATDHIENRLDLNTLVIQHAESTFFIRAKGQSMLGAGIHDGDVLVVDRALQPTHGQVVIAVIDGDFTVKRLHHQNGQVHLLPENPDYPTITFREGQELQIWGVVSHVVHAL